MRKNKKKRKQLYLLLLLLGITVGFALLSTTLKINGTAGIKSNQWDIHWENVQPNQQSTITAETPQITENATKVTYSVNLELPGDFYEFTVDAVNDGTINGKITDIQHKVYLSTDLEHTTTLPSYINYTLYYDGTTTPPAPDDILEAGETQTYRVRIEYDSEATTLPAADTTYVVVDEITYTQTKDSNTPPEPADTSVPGLWFYHINNDGEHTASVVALNYKYDADMIAFDNYGTSDFIDSFDEWQGPTIPTYIRDVVAPKKVKLDANGHYDPNGTEYTVTRFYDSPYASNAGLSEEEKTYIQQNGGKGFDQTTNLVGSMTFPNTYTVIELNGMGYNLLDALTVSDNLTTIDDLNMYSFEDYTNRGPKIEFTVPSHVTTLGENSICSERLKSVTVPATVTTINQDACCDWTSTKYYAADAATKARMEAAGCTVEPLE